MLVVGAESDIGVQSESHSTYHWKTECAVNTINALEAELESHRIKHHPVPYPVGVRSDAEH